MSVGAALERNNKPRPRAPMAWETRAACKGTPWTSWVMDGREEVSDWHRRICHSCPVYERCLMWALDADEHGVWAATTREQRKRLVGQEDAA